MATHNVPPEIQRKIRQQTSFRRFWVRRRLLIGISSGIVLLIVFVWFGVGLFPDTQSYLANLYTEGAGVVVTIFVLDLITSRRETNRVKETLVKQLSSSNASSSIQALEDLRIKGWLTNGMLYATSAGELNLADADLRSANLERFRSYGSDFRRAKMQYIKLSRAIFRTSRFDEADLTYAELTFGDFSGVSLVNSILELSDLSHSIFDRSNLHSANLSSANLYRTSLKGADLTGAIMRNAKLVNTDLTGANLSGADLQGAYMAYTVLKDVVMDEKTILPNGTCWAADHPNTNVQALTDPSHPYFYVPVEMLD